MNIYIHMKFELILVIEKKKKMKIISKLTIYEKCRKLKKKLSNR